MVKKTKFVAWLFGPNGPSVYEHDHATVMLRMRVQGEFVGGQFMFTLLPERRRLHPTIKAVWFPSDYDGTVEQYLLDFAWPEFTSKLHAK